MLVTPRFIFPAQMSFWMSAIQWPMNHIHHKLKISKLNSCFSSKPGILAFFCISINRIVFPIFEAQNFRIILFLLLSLTLPIHLMSDPVDSTFRICPQTNHSELPPLHTTSFLVWITAVASGLFPYFHVCPPIVCFQPRLYENRLLKTFHSEWKSNPPSGLRGHEQSDAFCQPPGPQSLSPSSSLPSRSSSLWSVHANCNIQLPDTLLPQSNYSLLPLLRIFQPQIPHGPALHKMSPFQLDFP